MSKSSSGGGSEGIVITAIVCGSLWDVIGRKRETTLLLFGYYDHIIVILLFYVRLYVEQRTMAISS